MNYAGYSIHAPNRATRRYGVESRCELLTTVAITCPFCGAATTAHGDRIRQHVEHCGFTLCPVSGMSQAAATARAATMTEDYRLPGEGAWND